MKKVNAVVIICGRAVFGRWMEGVKKEDFLGDVEGDDEFVEDVVNMLGSGV